MTWRMRAVGMALALAVVLPAQAGLEPVVGECDGTTCLWHEPAVHAPKGWEFKEVASSHYHARAFAPAGSNFANATAVMYAKAVPKEGQPATLAGFMAQDIASYRGKDAKLKVTTGLAYPDGDGHPLQAVQIIPGAGSGMQWQTVAYGEEGAFYLVFALSASGIAEHDAAVAAFRQMLASYHIGMPAALKH
jgi:hypothetical protein